jgi:PilZ domain-containing protein
MADTKSPSGPAAQRRASDRRSQPRYQFAADAELIEEKSGTRIEAHIADISERGCHAESSKALPLGTEAKIRISKGADFFSAQIRVVYSSGKSLGLAFSSIAADQLPILEAWLGSSRERDWLTLSRRRTQRVLLHVPVRVSTQKPTASRFEEETQTMAINAHGASIPLSTSVSKGQRLELTNIVTGDKAECIVAHLGQHHGNRIEVGVEFTLPNPKFWRVAFPPKDWTQPVSGS